MQSTRMPSPGFHFDFNDGEVRVNEEFGLLTPHEAVNLASALLQWASSVRPNRDMKKEEE